MPINLSEVSIEFPVMVLAFNKVEDIDLAVPVDITEVQNRTESCHLGLKEGTYNIVITNGKKSVKFEKSVNN